MSVSGAIALAEKGRSRKFTPKQKKFLKEFAKNDFKDPKGCALEAGYKTHYWELISSLKDDIRTIAESVLVGAAPEAALAISGILTSDKPQAGSQMKLAAAKEVLDRTGVIKTEKVSLDHKVSGGVFLLPVKHEIINEEEEYEYIEGEYEEA